VYAVELKLGHATSILRAENQPIATPLEWNPSNI
jgi:hypothetical protein